MGRFLINDYDNEINLVRKLQEDAAAFFSKYYFLKGAYSLTIQLVERGKPCRETRDVDFVVKEFDKGLAIERINEFNKSIQKYGEISWEEHSKTKNKDFCIAAFFSLNSHEIFNVDIGEGNVDDYTFINGIVDVRDTLADKLVLVLQGPRMLDRIRDVLDIVRIATWYEGEIRQADIQRKMDRRYKDKKLGYDPEFFAGRQRTIIDKMSEISLADVTSMEDVFLKALVFILPFNRVNYGDNLVWDRLTWKWVVR